MSNAQFTFTKATKFGSKLRMALIGTSGSGKTYSALSIASHLGGRVAFIDTEHGSARKYADVFEFDVIEFDSYAVENFLNGIQAAEAAGYDVLIIDSLSHAWSGKDGLLEFVDAQKAKSRSGNAFTDGWRQATPLHNKLIDSMLASKMHIIVCMRSKTEYVLQENDRGKKVPVKIGMQPVQREGMEYEFDVIGDMDMEHNLIVGKTRCREIDGKLFPKPGPDLAAILNEWLGGESAPDNPRPVSIPAPAAQSTAPVSAPARSRETEAARNNLRGLLSKLHEGNLFGFGDFDNVRAEMKDVLGVENLNLATDAHREGMIAWYTNLKTRMGKTDTPFDQQPTYSDLEQKLSEELERRVLPEAFAENYNIHANNEGYTATREELESTIAIVVKNCQLKTDFKLAEIDAEITSRDIPENIAETFAKQAASAAEKGHLDIMDTILSGVKGYHKKAVELGNDVASLHSRISELITLLAQSNIDGFEVSKRLTNSVIEHLGTKTVKQCTDAEKLASYALHLHQKLAEAKQEVSA